MLKVKPFREKSGYCGPASVKMVLDYYGLEKTEQEIADESGTSRDTGIEADKLVRYVHSLGLTAEYRDNSAFSDIEEFVKNKQIPVIVDWFSDDDGHYSVVVDIDKENIYLLDPEIGHIRAMRLNRFNRIWFDFPGEYITSKDELIIRRLIVIYPPRNKDG